MLYNTKQYTGSTVCKRPMHLESIDLNNCWWRWIKKNLQVNSFL